MCNFQGEEGNRGKRTPSSRRFSLAIDEVLCSLIESRLAVECISEVRPKEFETGNGFCRKLLKTDKQSNGRDD